MTKPTAMNCSQCIDRLADFVDRELTAEDVMRVEAHLDHCAACAREFRFEGAVVECIKAKLRRVRAPESLMERIRKLIV